jgi:hypothetical protein
VQPFGWAVTRIGTCETIGRSQIQYSSPGWTLCLSRKSSVREGFCHLEIGTKVVGSSFLKPRSFKQLETGFKADLDLPNAALRSSKSSFKSDSKIRNEKIFTTYRLVEVGLVNMVLELVLVLRQRVIGLISWCNVLRLLEMLLSLSDCWS